MPSGEAGTIKAENIEAMMKAHRAAFTGKRGAVLIASREIVESCLPTGVVIDCFADKIGTVGYSALKAGLLLPDTAVITGVSVSLRFDRDEIGIRIESPDFKEVPEGCVLPYVAAFYTEGANGPEFAGWKGDCVTANHTEIVPTPAEPWESSLDLPEPEIVESKPCST